MMRRGLLPALALSLLGFAPVATLAAEVVPPPANTVRVKEAPAGLVRVVPVVRTPLCAGKAPALSSLTLFLACVKENHPALRIADTERRLAQARYLERQGAFDSVFNSTSTYSRYNSATQLGKAKYATDNYASVDTLTRSGMKLSAGGKLVAGDITPPLSPTGDTGEYFAEAKLPLARNRGINPAFAAETKADLGQDLAQTVYERQRLSIMLKAAQTYTAWIAARQKIDVERNLLTLARFRRDQIARQAKNGDLPTLSVVEAEQEVRNRTGRYVRAERDLQEATFNLAFYLWGADGRPLPFSDREAPPTLGDPLAAPPTLLDDAKLQALRYRPEIANFAVSTQIARVDERLAKNALLPQLDAFVNTGYETGRFAIGPTFKVGLNTSIPLRRRTAEGQLAQAQLQITKLTLEQTQFVRQIFLDVENGVSAIEAIRARYVAAEEELARAVAVEEGERVNFTLGEGTLFMVNQRERITAEVRLQLVDLRARYAQAQADLAAVTGRL